MEERIRPTRSGLFSIELLICVGVFAFCAAVCTGIFVRAEVMSRESAELNQAVSVSRSLAERWKAAGGDLERACVLTGGAQEDGALVLSRDGLEFRLTPAEAGGEGTLTASSGGRVLLEWTVSALPQETTVRVAENVNSFAPDGISDGTNDSDESADSTDDNGESVDGTDDNGESADGTDDNGESADSTDDNGESADSTDDNGESVDGTDDNGESADGANGNGESAETGEGTP